jgi:hypothetical protein
LVRFPDGKSAVAVVRSLDKLFPHLNLDIKVIQLTAPAYQCIAIGRESQRTREEY